MVCLCHLRIGWHGATAPVLASLAGDLLLFLHLQHGFHQVQQHLHGDDGEMRMWFSGLLCMTRVSMEGKKNSKWDGWLLQGMHFAMIPPYAYILVVVVVVVD